MIKVCWMVLVSPGKHLHCGLLEVCEALENNSGDVGDLLVWIWRQLLCLNSVSASFEGLGL